MFVRGAGASASASISEASLDRAETTLAIVVYRVLGSSTVAGSVLSLEPEAGSPTARHLYLFDARSGAQFTRVRQLTVTASEPEESIGPLSLESQRSVAGVWDPEVTMRVPAFDQHETAIEIPVR